MNAVIPCVGITLASTASRPSKIHGAGCNFPDSPPPALTLRTLCKPTGSSAPLTNVLGIFTKNVNSKGWIQGE